MRRGRAVVGGLVFGVLAGGAGPGLAGCGGSGYQFVENDDLGVYAKLPDDWAVYDEEDLVEFTADDEISPEELERRTAGLWFRGFDASDEPSVQFDPTTGTPSGFVRVHPLSASQREQANLTMLRMLPTEGAIPISVSGEATPGVQVLLDEPAEFDGGYHGVHSVVALGRGDDVVMLDQTVLLDSTGSTAYMFMVGCDRHCYLDTHADEIEALVDSWTIQEDGR